MNLAEIAASALGLVGVILGIRRHRGVWWAWMASSLLYVWVYTQAALYGQALLMVAFVSMSLWGLRDWGRPQEVNEHKPLEGSVPLLVGAVLVGWLFVGGLLSIVDSSQAWLDSLVAVLSLLAMRLMGLKARSCWPVWMVVNALSVWLFLDAQLWATAVLYAIQLLLSIQGFRAWSTSRP